MTQERFHRNIQGFFAMDLDGTMLPQKMDKNPFYGLTHFQSHLRQTILEYARKAKENGYDLIILTARPEFIEPLLFGGTKNTKTILSDLEQYGISIESTERQPHGLKGTKMEEILRRYPGGKGILIDDQLIQVNSVRSLRNPKLKAYDINSYEDLTDYCAQMGINKSNYSHPEKIKNKILNSNPQLFALQQQLAYANHEKKEHIQRIINDLCVRLYEAEYRDYAPEIQWVNRVVDQIYHLGVKWIHNQTIDYQDIERASGAIFNNASLEQVMPNSHCDLLIKDFLNDSLKDFVVDDLKAQCTQFETLLLSRLFTPYLDTQKLQIVQNLIRSLENPNKDLALRNFAGILIRGKNCLAQAEFSHSFMDSLRLTLMKCPIIGKFFQTGIEETSTHLLKFFDTKVEDVLRNQESEADFTPNYGLSGG